MVMSPPVVEHLRTALLGTILVAVEDVGTLSEDLTSEATTPQHPDQPSKWAAYHERMAALRLRYELQQTVGLPGEPLAGVELSGPATQQAVVTEALTDYRDATVALLGEGRLSDERAEHFVERIEVINQFLSRHLAQDQEYRVA
jgi:hypothetical protein